MIGLLGPGTQIREVPRCQTPRNFAAWAYQNAWANHRLLKACAALSQEEFEATRTSFFPSIKATLNHILTVDRMYADAMERAVAGSEPHPDIGSFFEPPEPFANVAGLAPAQAAVDRRFIALCEAMTAADLERPVALLRAAEFAEMGFSEAAIWRS